MPPGLFIRADAGPQLGTGHVMRMVALAEAWRDRGGAVTFGGEVTPALRDRIDAIGADLVALDGDVDRLVTEARRVHASTIVADGYGFPLSFQRRLREAGFRLMVVDDNGENGTYDADWVLNVNVHAHARLYPGRVGRALLGPSWALIRGEIRRAATSRPVATHVAQVLLTMGGADPVDATGRLLEVLQARGVSLSVLVGAANPRLAAYHLQRRDPTQLHFNVTDVTTVMAGADLAVAAAGGTIWELALLGVPSLVVSLAENQVALARALHDLGAAEYLGDARADFDPADWGARVLALMQDLGRRRSLVTTARSLVDGNGALRVVDALWES